MKSWSKKHVAAFADSLRRIRHSSGSFLFNVIVVAAVLTLPFAGLTLLENLQPVAARISVDPEISVFMAKPARPDSSVAVTAIGAEIKHLAKQSHAASSVEFVSRDQALNQMKGRSGMLEIVAALGENPLPDAYIVRLPPFRNPAEAEGAEALAKAFRNISGVEQVQMDSAWVKRLSAVLDILRAGLLLLAAALGVVILAVVFNTIRLQVMTQREEIEISRLFGATDGYIYRPFYYAGALLGLSAGALALAAIAAGLPWINTSIAALARLYGSEFELHRLGLMESGGLLAASILLGCIGAGMSVRRHL